MGLLEQLVTLLLCYLSGRCHFVAYPSYNSTVRPIYISAPKSGTAIFLFFNNDLTEMFICEKVLGGLESLSTVKSVADSFHLQRQIEVLYEL